MKKLIVKYLGKEGHSNVNVYKFDNTKEDQQLAKEILAEGKAPIRLRPDVPGISYALPVGVPAYYYSPYENKKFRKENYHD